MSLGTESQFVRRFGSAWSEKKIPNLETVKSHLDNAILVAIDMRGWLTSISQVGLASTHICPSNPLQVAEDQGSTLQTFYDMNNIQAHALTIPVFSKKRRRSQEGIKFGNHESTNRDDVEKRLNELVSGLTKESVPLILVGFAMYNNFEWISLHYPSFFSHFKYWVDVQNLVEECCGSHPGLSNTMSALNIHHGTPGKDIAYDHKASNEAVRTLAVLATLMSRGNFVYQAPPQELRLRARNWSKLPYKARITSVDNGLLPDCIRTPRELGNRFAAYQPNRILINNRASTSGVSVWWLSFSSRHSLDRFALEIDHSVMDGKQLAVEKVFAPGVIQREAIQIVEVPGYNPLRKDNEKIAVDRDIDNRERSLGIARLVPWYEEGEEAPRSIWDTDFGRNIAAMPGFETP